MQAGPLHVAAGAGGARGLGLKVGPATPTTYEARVRALSEGHPTLMMFTTAVLNARAVFAVELRGLERRVRELARDDERARRLMTTPGVLVSLTFVSAIDGPERFRSSRMVRAHFGLTPSRCQSGETDHSGRISKVGDTRVRAALYEAANVILTHRVRSSDLKTWALGSPGAQGCAKPRSHSPESSLSCCTRCCKIEPTSSPTAARLSPLSKEATHSSGGLSTIAFPASLPREDDLARQQCPQGPNRTAPNERSADGSHRAATSVDCGQKQASGEEMTLKGLTQNAC